MSVTSSGSWPGDETAEAQLNAVSPAERRVLATLAVVGRASLSADELAELVEVDEVAPLIEELERRGLVERGDRDRYSVLGRVGEEIRRTDDAMAAGDRLLTYMTTLAKGGALTPERLVEDAEAILGLSEWVAQHREWAAVLELVKTLQACFGIAHRVQEWLTLLERGRIAARALGDHGSEVWMLRQLATASASAGDVQAADRYLREADGLQRSRHAGPRNTSRTDEALSAGGRMAVGGRGVPRLALGIIGLLLAATVGTGAAFVIGSGDGKRGTATVRMPVTVTLPGQTVTTSETVTLPATTGVSTATVVSTATEVRTVTETTTVTTTTATAPITGIARTP
jgi:hypothetical protein